MTKSILILGLAALLLLSLGASCEQDVEQTADKATGTKDIQIMQQSEKDLAIIKARELCQVKLAEGEDLSQGPCLDENLMTGWVADIAHDPRVEMDNDSTNQCQNFIDGTAEHFVELTTTCELIKAE